MKIYTDSELKNEIQEFDLGIVRAGETKQYEYYLHNDTNAELRNLTCAVDNKEVKLVSVPTLMEAMQKTKIIIEWSPSVTIKQGLKCAFCIKGDELWS